MPTKDIKFNTDAKPTERHKKALVDHRDYLIMTAWRRGFTKAELAFVFNLRINNIAKIIKKYE